MMMRFGSGEHIEIGKLTEEETRELIAACIPNLTDEILFECLNAALNTEQKEELGETWFNIDRK